MLQLKRSKTTLLEAPFKEEDKVVFLDVSDHKLFREGRVLSNCIGAKTLTIKIREGGLETLTYDESARVLMTMKQYEEHLTSCLPRSNDGSMTMAELRDAIPHRHTISIGDEVCFVPTMRKYRHEGFSMEHPIYGDVMSFLFGVMSSRKRRGDKMIVSTSTCRSMDIQKWVLPCENTYFVSKLRNVPDEAKSALKDIHKKLGI